MAIEIDLGFVWVAENILISVWGIEIDLIAGLVSKLYWVCGGHRNLLGFSVWIKTWIDVIVGID